eukprot:m.117310 g.117310  ORF g.117310 m.117310 type:complete len:390 (+) comp13182_c0_seq2:232-1401(+)
MRPGTAIGVTAVFAIGLAVNSLLSKSPDVGGVGVMHKASSLTEHRPVNLKPQRVKRGAAGGANDATSALHSAAVSHDPESPEQFTRNSGAAIARVDFPNKFRMWVHNRTECMYISQIVLDQHRWPGEDRMVEKILDVLKQIEGPNSDKLFLDIGTNIGFYTFNVAAAGVATASFEALEYNAELVRGSIGLNPSFSERVNLFKSAVSSAPAPAMCVHSAGGNPRNQGNGMLVPAEECAQSGSLTSTEQVPVNRIDALIHGSKLKGRCIDVIKADIEGFEAEALRGSVGAWEQGGCKPCLVQFEYIRKYAEKGGRDGNSIFEFLIGEQGYKCNQASGRWGTAIIANDAKAWTALRDADYECRIDRDVPGRKCGWDHSITPFGIAVRPDYWK